MYNNLGGFKTVRNRPNYKLGISEVFDERKMGTYLERALKNVESK